MSLGERIRACRQSAGMSQEKLAEAVGVSRQAVTKWESGQSAPSTEKLFKLAEVFGTSVDMLLASGDKNIKLKNSKLKKNLLFTLLIVLGYMTIYFIGRIVWCDMSQSNLMGFLFTAAPSGKHSYLYGWLLSSGLFWLALAISALPALFGKRSFSIVTLLGFVIGLAAGMIFGPYPEGAAIGHDHYGWLIWGAVYLASIAAGLIHSRLFKA